jgi:hypothetical protein
VTVLQLVRGPTSARLRSALGRWNPVEQTGLCIYSCFRTYRLELFNRVLSNQPTPLHPVIDGVLIPSVPTSGGIVDKNTPTMPGNISAKDS